MKIAATFAIAVLLAGTAAAEDLTLDRAVAEALANNPSVRAAGNNAAAMAEAIGIARAAYYPTLSADARGARWQSHAFLPAGLTKQIPISTVGPTDDWSAGIDVTYLLYDSGRRRAEVAAARAAATGAEAEADRAALEIAFAVHQTFFAVEAAEAAIRAAESRAARSDEHLRLATIRKEAGAVPSIDVVRARVEIANARAALARAQSNRAIAAGTLNTLLARPVDAPVEIATQPEARALPALDQALQVAVESRPELAAARHRAEASRRLVDVARSARGPRVALQGGYGWRDDDFLPEDEEWSVGVGVNFDIFTGFARRHRVARAALEQKRDEAAADDVELRVRKDVWAALQEAGQAVATLDASAAAVREAEEAVRLARARYEAGAGTINDLLDAESALLAAESQQIASTFDREAATSAVLRATGELLP